MRAHPPPALATGSTPQAVTWSQSAALWGQGWVKIAWAGTSQLPLKTRHPWVHVDPPHCREGAVSGHRPTMESLVCVASQYPGDMEQTRVMMGFSFGWQEPPLEEGLQVPTPQIQRGWARTAYSDTHPHDPPILGCFFHRDMTTMVAVKQS